MQTEANENQRPTPTLERKSARKTEPRREGQKELRTPPRRIREADQDGRRGGMKYEFTSVDLAWMARVLEMLAEGGILVYPSSGLIYKVSHLKRTLTLQNTALLMDEANRELHEMTTVVASFFDYTVKEAAGNVSVRNLKTAA